MQGGRSGPQGKVKRGWSQDGRGPEVFSRSQRAGQEGTMGRLQRHVELKTQGLSPGELEHKGRKDKEA